MSMTYQGLKNRLEEMTSEELNNDVSICVGGEFYELESVEISEDCDVLDDGHPYLFVED